MNVLFHIAIGTSIVASSSNSDVNSDKQKYQKIFTGFLLGIISHGALDYIPHCYPINSKVDVIISLIYITIGIFITKPEWKLIFAFTILGSILPDLIDLSPRIINSILKTNLPTFDNIFPWHFHEYSGSIYTDKCGVSTINHILTIIFCGIIIWINRENFKKLI